MASFNIQIFGDAKVRKASVANTLVEIFNMFDLVAVQEIRDADLSGIDTFVNTYRGWELNVKIRVPVKFFKKNYF